MAFKLEMMLGGFPFLKVLDFLASEFDDFPAAQADHVVVMAVPKDVFVEDAAASPIHRREETSFHQQAQGAVNGGPGGMRVCLPCPVGHLIR